MTKPLLCSPLTLRGLQLRNRVVISPMCQYSAVEGMAGHWHFAHLARFGIGGAGLVFTEAAAVERNGRITYGDLGIWSDAHIAPLARIAAFLKSQGAVPAMQLAHAGRKASMQRPGPPPRQESSARSVSRCPMRSASATTPAFRPWRSA